MTNIVENQDKLLISCHGAIRYGARQYLYNISNDLPTFPDYLEVRISFRDTATPDIFKQIEKELMTLYNLEGAEGEIEVAYKPMQEIYSDEVKEEYQEKDRQIKEEQKAKWDEINILVSRLLELDYEIVEYRYGGYVTPEEWLKVKELDVTTAFIRVGCHKGTRFYKILHEAGILQRSYLGRCRK